MRYDYLCSVCSNEQEESHGMLERPIIQCNECGHKCIKLICGEPHFCGVDGTAQMYNFVDYNTTGKPVVINSKTQWKNHLKKHGLNDDIKNDPYTKSELESIVQKKNSDKLIRRKEIKKSLVEVYKQKNTSQFKERVKKVIKKGEKNGR